MRFDYPVDVCFSCSKCGLCCGDTEAKVRHVLLLKSDAERIAAEAKREIVTFASEISEKVPYVYEMHKDPSGKCVFLQENCCTIYEARPLICRFYPFELSGDEKGNYSFRVTDECSGVCPGTEGVGKKLAASYFRALLGLALAEFNDRPC